MVKGIKVYKEYFKEFTNNYVLIGGAACDERLEDAGLSFRVTKDLDIILVVEALDDAFIEKFWQFIKDGSYKIQEKGQGRRILYRFKDPEKQDFPFQVELFAKDLGLEGLSRKTKLTPIPVNDELSSLSAILMNDDYYHFTLDHSKIMDEMQLANPEALICLKAIAYMDNKKRREEGANINRRDVIKHKNDVFRLALMLAPENTFKLPETIKTDMLAFANTVKNNLPDNAIFKEMGAGSVDVEALFEQLLKNFNLIS